MLHFFIRQSLKQPFHFSHRVYFSQSLIEGMSDLFTPGGKTKDIFNFHIRGYFMLFKVFGDLIVHNMPSTQRSFFQLALQIQFQPVLMPLLLDKFESFFETLWRSKVKPRHIRMTIKSDFLKWLARQSGIPAGDIADSNGRVLEDLFAEIEQELGEVSTKDLDPRFTNLFLLK